MEILFQEQEIAFLHFFGQYFRSFWLRPLLTFPYTLHFTSIETYSHIDSLVKS